MTTRPVDLRTRRRQETERAIRSAAFRLVGRHGFDQVTVEMISAEAGVSRRTFSNYFPNKEAVVAAGPGQFPDEARAEFLAAVSTEPVVVLRDLTRLLLRGLAQNIPDQEEARTTLTLAQEHPSVLAALLASYDAFEHEVASIVAQRLGQRDDDELPALISAIALSAIRTGLRRWPQDACADASPIPQIERTVALLHTLLAP